MKFICIPSTNIPSPLAPCQVQSRREQARDSDATNTAHFALCTPTLYIDCTEHPICIPASYIPGTCLMHDRSWLLRHWKGRHTDLIDDSCYYPSTNQWHENQHAWHMYGARAQRTGSIHSSYYHCSLVHVCLHIQCKTPCHGTPLNGSAYLIADATDVHQVIADLKTQLENRKQACTKLKTENQRLEKVSFPSSRLAACTPSPSPLCLP